MGGLGIDEFYRIRFINDTPVHTSRGSGPTLFSDKCFADFFLLFFFSVFPFWLQNECVDSRGKHCSANGDPICP